MADVGEDRRFRKNRPETHHRIAKTRVPASSAGTDPIELFSRLLRVQDEERRSMARDLHDTVLQDLAGALMIVDRLGGANGSLPATHEPMDELGALIARSVETLKQFSNVLYPPLLDEVGLPSALKSLIREFEKRTGVGVRLKVQRYNAVLRDRKTEHALFRMVQEVLLNVDRPSNPVTAEVRLEQNPQATTVEIKGPLSVDIADIPAPGLHMMRARLQQLGGRLKISSTASATTISATVPNSVGRERASSIGVHCMRSPLDGPPERHLALACP